MQDGPRPVALVQVREGRWGKGAGWAPEVAVNERAQSGLGLVHILAALGYDWGLQLLLPLGANLELQVPFRLRLACCHCQGL